MKKDITKKYKVGKYTIKFDSKDWTWRAVNYLGCGVDSDLSLIKLKKRIKSLSK